MQVILVIVGQAIVETIDNAGRDTIINDHMWKHLVVVDLNQCLPVFKLSVDAFKSRIMSRTLVICIEITQIALRSTIWRPFVTSLD
jgi:hypothetical protein